MHDVADDEDVDERFSAREMRDHARRELYRGLGRNAARYARSAEPEPLFLAESSEPLGPNYHARVVALVALERRSVVAGDPVEVEAAWRT